MICLLLQTWKVASSNVSLMVGKRVLQGKYEMTDSSHVWTPDLGDHLGDEIWDIKGAGIFSISLLVEEIRLNVLEDSIRLYKESAWMTGC
ncbi:hypothetical protein AVEN_98054-1 [Araneus ventricosus]|uniref:Uncharacterized protein n=1 Tax=Araneus ventricosus TaxID=182803 RepID=A0A4Y2P6M2_ARAVE|nr:hypothetical protein AVEN_98054-1 [Araneus ventricosus]